MRAGLHPLSSFMCRVTTSKKNDLKERLARYRKIKLSVIGRKSEPSASSLEGSKLYRS